MLLRPTTGLLTPRAGGRPHGAHAKPLRDGGLIIYRATAPLPGGAWFQDNLDELLADDPEAAARGARLNDAGTPWRFTPARERWTFSRPCTDPLTGQMLQYHQPATPPPPHHAPELYQGERAPRLLALIRRNPAAWCRQCRLWIDQNTGEEF